MARGKMTGPLPVLAVRFYRTPAGAQPVREWLRSLPRLVRREIGADIFRVQCTWPIGKPLVDGLGGGLYEVRTSYDREEYRIFFFVEGTNIVLIRGTMVLVHGIHKKTQKAPNAAVTLARKRMKEDKPK
jgi:phage-related protein